jgi:hypothetical protein
MIYRKPGKPFEGGVYQVIVFTNPADRGIGVITRENGVFKSLRRLLGNYRQGKK